MEEYLGKDYVLVRHEGFEDYLKCLGHNYFMRKVASTLKPVHCLSKVTEDTWKFTMTSVLASSTIHFTVGQEFDELRPPSDKVKSLVTIEDNKMIHSQREENGRTSRHVREFSEDQMIVTTTVDGHNLKCIRYHELVKDNL